MINNHNKMIGIYIIHRSASIKIFLILDEFFSFFSKNSPQNLHFIASSCISSEQKGHIFIKLKLRY